MAAYSLVKPGGGLKLSGPDRQRYFRPKLCPNKFETKDGEHTVTIDGVLEAAFEKFLIPCQER
ncbi:MAG: hypothetical protein Ct9H300mP11_10750 [Chloroflexota bacterium]|nr:MAG: hypothetical protein Ct9H300mP11_10750 [Chloroflexota bacterium]